MDKRQENEELKNVENKEIKIEVEQPATEEADVEFNILDTSFTYGESRN